MHVVWLSLSCVITWPSNSVVNMEAFRSRNCEIPCNSDIRTRSCLFHNLMFLIVAVYIAKMNCNSTCILLHRSCIIKVGDACIRTIINQADGIYEI